MPSISRKIGSAAFAAVLAVSRPAAALGAGAGRVVLPGHVPRQISAATKLERVPAGENVDLSLVVRVDPDLMARTLADLYGPGSPARKRFLSSSEFIQKFDLARKRQALKDFAAGAGLTISAEDKPGSLVVKVSGPSGRVEKAFDVQLHHYRSADGQVFRANDTDPTIPESLVPHLNAVLGLSSFRGAKKPRLIRGRPASARSKAARSSTTGAASPAVWEGGTGPSLGLAPTDIKSIYGLSGALNGTGQTVSLLELDGYSASDIGLYESQFGLASPAVTCTSADGSCPTTTSGCGPNQTDPCNVTTLNGGQSDETQTGGDGGMIEVALDIEMMIALAPGVSQIQVYTGLNTDGGLLTAYSDMANDDTAKVISTSWGEDEEDAYKGLSTFMTSESEVFAQMATQGQTIFSAAGDAGAYDASGVTNSNNHLVSWAGSLMTDDPASQPYVTGVGGTSLSGSIASHGETVWNGYIENGTDYLCSGTNNPGTNCAAYGAGGGGVADYVGGSTTYWPLPSYQSGVGGIHSGGRNVPDVALNADPNSGYSICVGGSCNACSAPLPAGSDGSCDDTCTTSCNTIIGGTSAAAPLWAALTALVNQQRATYGTGSLGFANTAIYTLGTGASYASSFNDIVTGNNGEYYAGTGYDDASGWGSYKASALINALAPVPAASPAITSSLVASGTAGSAFSYTITASNGPTSYSAAGLPAGLSVNTSNGVISGTPTSAGTTNVTISAANAGGTGTATLVLTIHPAAPVITSSLAASGVVGTGFSYSIAASNGPTSYNATGLPGGLSVNTSNGVISGTPTSAGTTSVAISAANAGGTGSATLVLTVALSVPPAPVITSALSASGTAGAAFGYSITASNSPTSYSATGLPAGLSVNASDGVISGTPAAAGTTSVTIRATNAGGTGSATLVLTINPAGSTYPVITSALSASGTAGAAFSYSITASNAPTSYGAAGLPAGLSVNTSNGVISGTPASAGTTSVAIRAVNAGGTGSATLVLTIAPPAPVITSALSASGSVGAAFSYSITASNGPTSYGAAGLPAGLSVNASNGVISGTPASAGTTAASISAANAGGTGAATLIFTINTLAPVITSALSATGGLGVPFSYAITASNGPTSYNAAGLPAGLAVNASDGVISGTPTSAGTASASISAANAGGAGAATLVLTVYSALSSGTVSGPGLSLALPQTFPQLTSIGVFIPPGAFPAGTPIVAGANVDALPAAVTNEAPSIAPFGTNAGLVLSAGGLQPATPVTITMAYDFTQIPAGQSESRLQLWRYDPIALQWTLIPSQVDASDHILTAQTPHFSTFAPFFVAAGADVSGVQVWPQPWEIGDASSQYWSSVLSFSNLPGGATVKIFTIRGELAWSGTAAADGTLGWDGNNRFGRRVASGTYYASFQNGGQTKTRRLVIIR